MKSRFLALTALMVLPWLSACEQTPESKTELLLYCGITMVKPMLQLAQAFEEKHPNVQIILSQGGSQDLYDALHYSQQGDLYLPGSQSYLTNNQAAGDFVADSQQLLGYNRVALMVQKGNPKQINGDLQQLADPKLAVVLCNPESGSIGRASQSVLKKANLDEATFANAIYLTTDSRRLTEALVKKEADLVLNWYATSKWQGNRDKVDAILVDETLSPKKALVLTTLSFSKHPELAKKFVDFAASQHGRDVFRSFGFLTDDEYHDLSQP